MSLHNIPTIPGVDPSAVRALTRLCSGDESGQIHMRKPYIFYIGDDPYLLVTDGSTLVLLLLENGLPPKEEVEWDETVQTSVGGLLELFGTDYITYYEDVEVGDLLAWCKEGTSSCPKCGGTKTCMYPRHGSTMANREASEVWEAHVGLVHDVPVDRRRIQVTLQMLGVDEGTCDLSVYVGPETTVEAPEDSTRTRTCFILVGENWRILSAPLKHETDEKTPRFVHKAP